MADDLSPESTVFDLMDVGYSLARIGQLRKGRKLGPTRRDSEGMVQRMITFCNAIEELELPKSSKLARKLLDGRLAQLERAVEKYSEAELYAETAKELRANLTDIWDSVSDEASRQKVYVIQPSV